MKPFLVTAAAITVLFASPQVFAGNSYSTQQCKAWFNKVDRNKDGSIGSAENADGFLARITLASETEGRDGTYIMSKAFFVAECSIGSLGKPSL
jgi:hypothetical protein